MSSEAYERLWDAALAQTLDTHKVALEKAIAEKNPLFDDNPAHQKRITLVRWPSEVDLLPMNE